MKQYAKFLAQVAATVMAAVATALVGDNHISTNEWVNVAILALGAVGVVGAGNLPAGIWAHTKAIVSAATAGLVLLQSVLTGGVSTTEWFQVALAVLGALGVFAVRGPVVVPAASRGRI